VVKALRFVVDELDFDAVNSSEVIDLFEVLVERLQICRGSGISKSSRIWETNVAGQLISDWIFGKELDRDTRQAISTALERCPNWDENIDDELLLLDSRTYVAWNLSHGRALGCISPRSAGTFGVNLDGVCIDVQYVGDKKDLLTFHRRIAEIENLDEEAYFRNAAFAFPALFFVRDRTKFNRFDEKYQTVRAIVTVHLAVLDDHAKRILSNGNPASTQIAEFGSGGIEVSGENGNTRANKAAMKQREVEVNNKRVVCDWHTKLRPHMDRIYFNATAEKGCVVVGIFHSHLD
jgi:hypothetical protein